MEPKKTKPRSGARGIQSIEVSGRILKTLVKAGAPMMLKDLAHAAELAPAQCHAYLTSLRHVGLVHQEFTSGLYNIGPMAMSLGFGWLKTSPIASASVEALKELTEELGPMSALISWSDFGPTVVHVNTGMRPATVNVKPGTLFSVTGTATGSVFAAFGDPEAVERQIAIELSRKTSRASLGLEPIHGDYADNLEKVRRDGCATAEGAPIPGINAIAHPIFDKDGKLALVATLIGPAGEFDVSETSHAMTRLKAVAQGLSAGAQASAAAE